jgi:hypothetical protein
MELKLIKNKYENCFGNRIYFDIFLYNQTDKQTKVYSTFTLRFDIFWDIARCSTYINRRFGGTYRLHLQDRKLAKQKQACS